MAKGDVAAINEALKQIEPDALKLCRMCPFRLAVLNRKGDTVTVYPYNKQAMGNFASYETVAKTLKNRKIYQKRLFLQDGTEIYVICVPLLRGESLQGVLIMSLGAEEAKSRWGLTEQDFTAIDFNQK